MTAEDVVNETCEDAGTGMGIYRILLRHTAHRTGRYSGALKVFDLPWVLSPNGAPQGLTHFLGTYMYQTAYGLNNYDYVSTQALLIVVLGVVVSKGVGWMQH